MTLHQISSCPSRPRSNKPNSRPSRVVLLDDHHLVRLALRTLLEDEPDLSVVAEADSLQSGRRALAAHQPDLLVLDVQLPDGDGIDLCSEATQSGVRVVILTAFSSREILVSATRAGASGFLLKQDRPDEIVGGIRTVAAGGAHFSTDATPQLMSMIAGDSTIEDPFAGLTPRERDLIELLGEGLSNRQIAERLFLGERTVKNYVSRLLRKLNMERRAEAAVFATRIATERRMQRYSISA